MMSEIQFLHSNYKNAKEDGANIIFIRGFGEEGGIMMGRRRRSKEERQ